MFIREVQTENGRVRGIQAADPRITAYKGIPFAAPPVGENRWRAPQPCKDWEGTLECFDFKPISMQNVPPLDEKNVYTCEWSVDPDLAMSEDCLYLNIWAPAAPDLKNLPVFVWYFGGGLQVGHPSEMEFDGERIARRGIVVVTVNYRLNAFGFLCHPEITKENPDAPANFGHLDQQAGTRWVQRNIAAFGGDPNNITIGGQSAGGGSVMNQLTSPQNGGLCRRAIVQSGVSANAYPNKRRFGSVPPLSEAEQKGTRFFESLGVRTLAEARNIDGKVILDKIREENSFWGTVNDGKFCVDDAMTLFMQNKRLMCPVLWGRTSSEFFVAPEDCSEEGVRGMAKAAFGEDAGEFLEIVDIEGKDEAAIRKATQLPGIELAIRSAAQKNAETGANQPLYYYVFDAEIPGWDNAGTFHSVDLWFFFETLAKCWRPFVGKHYDLARQMCSYWAYFIKSGNPNGPDADGQPLLQWDAFTPDHPACMVMADEARQVIAPPSRLMAFMMRQYLKQKGV
ncbi:MAG: carboxylesterase/lipase family protein [Christensenellales bacterium]|jgi:para-nitrobenzyl esterase